MSKIPTPIAVGQVYRSCDPRDQIRLRVTAWTPGHLRAHVEDATTGKRPRRILVAQLHDSPTTRTGEPRRRGYALQVAA